MSTNSALSDDMITAGDRKVPRLVKLAYGLGGAVQNGGFDTAIGFTFFYYSAVLGLSASLVGLALAVGLVFDALVDPFIGSWSDNLKSRLGRRLPPAVPAGAGDRGRYHRALGRGGHPLVHGARADAGLPGRELPAGQARDAGGAGGGAAAL